MLEELQRTGESQLSLTDPDSRAMAMNPKVGVGYNVQVAVDSKHKLIVEQEVTNAGRDLGLLGRVCKSSMRGEGDQDGKAYEAQKSFSEFVKASGDSTVTLDFLEEVFHSMTTPVELCGKW
jgi:hypothetical protein